MGVIHHAWLAEVAKDIQRNYDEARLIASNASGIQESGHEAETHWLTVLNGWLPPQYEAVARKYLLLEQGDREVSAETDIVVFRPSFPDELRKKNKVLVAGVAAAFSVKLTLDRAGIADAVKEAARVRQATVIRSPTVEGEVLPPFLYGLLAHSHVWTKPRSTPVTNVTRALTRLDQAHADYPREGLDIVCVADLNCWSRVTTVLSTPSKGSPLHSITPDGGVWSGFVSQSQTKADRTPSPVATFIAVLLEKLSHDDRTLTPLADGLRVTGTHGELHGQQRKWFRSDALSSDARDGMVNSPWSWRNVYH